MERIRRIRFFFVWQDEKEEAWLREMARAGWHLDALPFPCVYWFRAGKPRDVVFRLDYNPDSGHQAAYLQLFADAGWMHVGRCGNWQYFRIEPVSGESPEIYTDNASKAVKYRRVLGHLAILLPIVVVVPTNLAQSPYRPLAVLGAMLLVTYAYAVLMLVRRLRQLRPL